jgi:hypothetical protein
MDDRAVGVACEKALDGDAVAAYVAGRLDPSEAEAFEQHFFTCEECWALVQTATAARGSFVEEPRSTGAAGPRARARWAPLVPAAGLAAAIAGVTLFGVFRTEQVEPAGEVFRGPEGTMALDAEVDETTLRASWAPVAGAAAYELRVYDADGRLLRASEVNAQTLAVDIDVLELGGTPSVAALDVVALDGLGQALLRSQRVDLAR